MNSSARIAAARYAAAYDGLSNSIKQAEQYALELKNARQVLAGVRTHMQSPRVSTTHKKLIVQETLQQWPHATALICMLLDAKRYILLDEIYAQVNFIRRPQGYFPGGNYLCARTQPSPTAGGPACIIQPVWAYGRSSF